MKKHWWKLTEKDIDTFFDKWYKETPVDEIIDLLYPECTDREDLRKAILIKRYYKEVNMEQRIKVHADILAKLMLAAIENGSDLLISAPIMYGKSSAIEVLKTLVINKYFIGYFNYNNYKTLDFSKSFDCIVIDDVTIIPRECLEKVLNEFTAIPIILIATPIKDTEFNRLFLDDVGGRFEKFSIKGENIEEFRIYFSLDMYKGEVLGEVL